MDFADRRDFTNTFPDYHGEVLLNTNGKVTVLIDVLTELFDPHFDLQITDSGICVSVSL